MLSRESVTRLFTPARARMGLPGIKVLPLTPSRTLRMLGPLCESPRLTAVHHKAGAKSRVFLIAVLRVYFPVLIDM